MFIGQQYMQDVLPARCSRPAGVVCGRLHDPAAARSAKIVEARGSRFTLLVAMSSSSSLPDDAAVVEEGFCLGGGLAFTFVGIGIGLSGTPARAR
jgi:hypothetical protein